MPEKFWSIKVIQRRDDINVSFSWRRNRLFDRMAVIVLFERCLTARVAKVSKLQKKPTSKWRPLPLTTVELQKLGSMFLRLDSQRVMKVNKSTEILPQHLLIASRLRKNCTPKAGLATHELKPTVSTKGSILGNSSKSKFKIMLGVLMHKGKNWSLISL